MPTRLHHHGYSASVVCRVCAESIYREHILSTEDTFYLEGVIGQAANGTLQMAALLRGQSKHFVKLETINYSP